MEENSRRYRQQNNYYDGNAVRKLGELPEEEDYPSYGQPERELPQRERRREENIPGVKRNPGVRRKTRKKQQALDIFSVFVLTMAICATLYTCVGYLKVQTEITRKNNTVAELERKLAKMENDNDASLARIDTSVDLNYIYKYATKKLGMVYPDDKQVIPYKRNVSDYVKQYADIPQADEKSILDKIKKQN